MVWFPQVLLVFFIYFYSIENNSRVIFFTACITNYSYPSTRHILCNIHDINSVFQISVKSKIWCVLYLAGKWKVDSVISFDLGKKWCSSNFWYSIQTIIYKCYASFSTSSESNPYHTLTPAYYAFRCLNHVCKTNHPLFHLCWLFNLLNIKWY